MPFGKFEAHPLSMPGGGAGTDRHAGSADLHTLMNNAGSYYNVKGAVTLICQIASAPRNKKVFFELFISSFRGLPHRGVFALNTHSSHGATYRRAVLPEDETPRERGDK